jgi:hypothetical protein
MFDEVPEWSTRYTLRRDAARHICRLLLVDLRRTMGGAEGRTARRRIWALRWWQWGLLARWTWRAVTGSSWVMLQARLGQLAARARLEIALLRRDRSGAENHLARYCDALAMAHRTRLLAAWGLDGSDPSAEQASVSSEGCWKPDAIGEQRAVGFHLASGSGAEAIRWSEPAAYVELPLAPGRYTITVSWLFHAPVVGERRLGFFLDEHPVPIGDVQVFDDHADIRIEIGGSSSRSRLGWVCAASRAEGDERALGIPLTRIAWAAAAHSG